ncbi:hypothetical protein BTH_I0105 [Burkholderia thailandensis E264]|uniref:Uncharacterized protein n=1 Tax=Burkholderia thailandensis (strain ATCC 700388 / DSM 13276 / CCUG 48851 / CIP 106301 / E264) TaxID=271848 RepID=Q2T2D4_BURTA|nr:hypothetical protein BTH_I0105 [Burkholderia thailandensis E264]
MFQAGARRSSLSRLRLFFSPAVKAKYSTIAMLRW